MTSGTLYGIGAGPGDPELITLRGLRLLQRIRRVFLPATTPGRSYAGEVVAPHLDAARHEVTLLVCPPLRDREALLARWSDLARQVAAALATGEDAAFITEGDPSLYSTFQYLVSALRRDHPGVPVETVPGVTSACAAAAVAGTALAMWDEPFTIVPATAGPAAVAAALDTFGGVAVLKPGSGMAQLESVFAERSAEFDYTLVRRAGRPEQAVLRGGAAVAGAATDYFSLLIVRRKRP